MEKDTKHNINLKTSKFAQISLNEKQRKLFFLLASSVIGLSFIYWIYWFFYSSNYISTDNAYVGAEIAEVTSLVDGAVKDIKAIDTQYVQKGDTLVIINDEDSRLALKQAEAKLLKAEADLKHTEAEYQRRKALRASGSVSVEELSQKENVFRMAKATLEEANAQKEIAQLNHTRTKILAPISGVVARRQIQLGQKVTPGTKILSIVPLYNVHVDANFKETQLHDIKPGQPVILFSDKYGSGVKYRGKVQGFSGGTGSTFSLIPAQNATGNWIKVIQRLPVRIALDSEELVKMPLEVGLSMHVTIDISKR